MARRTNGTFDEIAGELAHELESDVHGGARAEVDMLNDHGTTHLPTPDEVGGSGYQSYGGDGFNGAGVSIGRSIAVPMFEHASAFPQAKQLRVWEMIEGVPQALGVCAITTTEEEFVRKFRGAMPGKFQLRPIDMNGRYVGQEFHKVVSPHHAALRAVVNADGPQNGHSGPSHADFLMSMLELQREEMRELRLKMEEDRQILARERMELAEERTALASNAAMGVQSVAERMMSADQARQDQITHTLSGMFTQQIQLMQATAEQERLRHSQRLEAMKAEQTFAMERERERLAREREKEREWAHARRQESERAAKREAEDARGRERMRKVEMEDARAREREHAERMMQLSQKDGLSTVKKMLGDFGMKPVDLLDLVRGDQGSSDPTLGTTIVKGITEVGRSFADAAKANVEAQAKVQAHQANAQARMAQLEMVQRLETDDDQYIEEDGTVYEEPEQGPVPVQYSTQDPRVAAAFSANPQPVQASPGQPANLATGQAPPPRLQMPLPELRKARRGVRQMIQTCQAADESKWEDIITNGILSETSIIQYVTEATIRRALVECGSDQQFATRMIAAIDRSGLVPAHIPRG
jgi:hypothetical protein